MKKILSKHKKNKPVVIADPHSAVKISKNLIKDVCVLIESVRSWTAQAINSGLVILYWGIGDRIRREILKRK